MPAQPANDQEQIDVDGSQRAPRVRHEPDAHNPTQLQQRRDRRQLGQAPKASLRPLPIERVPRPVASTPPCKATPRFSPLVFNAESSVTTILDADGYQRLAHSMTYANVDRTEWYSSYQMPFRVSREWSGSKMPMCKCIDKQRSTPRIIARTLRRADRKRRLRRAITKPVLYNYFAGKDAILVEYYRLGIEMANVAIREAGAEARSGFERMQSFIRAYSKK